MRITEVLQWASNKDHLPKKIRDVYEVTRNPQSQGYLFPLQFRSL